MRVRHPMMQIRILRKGNRLTLPPVSLARFAMD